jgi:hypothetical protein
MIFCRHIAQYLPNGVQKVLLCRFQTFLRDIFHLAFPVCLSIVGLRIKVARCDAEVVRACVCAVVVLREILSNVEWRFSCRVGDSQ